MKKNKLLALVLTICLTVGLLPSLTANAAVNDNNTVKIESKTDKIKENKDNKLDTTTTTLDLSGTTTTSFNEDMLRESKGVKSKAVIKIATMLLKNTNKLIGTLKWAGMLDEESALALGANCYKLSSYLERIANYGEDAAAFVRSNLPSVMTSWGVDAGVSKTVANALGYAIQAADWLFV